MKKLLRCSFIYFIAAMIGGVFYREFTKALHFTGTTTLAFLHLHLLVLGTMLFLILALYAKQTSLLRASSFSRFYRLYNLALPFMVLMLLIRGVCQVKEVALSSSMDHMISGLAGLSHVLIFIAFIFLFKSLHELE